jgi:hypothetical protein
VREPLVLAVAQPASVAREVVANALAHARCSRCGRQGALIASRARTIADSPASDR